MSLTQLGMRKTITLVATRTQHEHARNQTEKYGEGTTVDMKMKEQCNIK